MRRGTSIIMGRFCAVLAAAVTAVAIGVAAPGAAHADGFDYCDSPCNGQDPATFPAPYGSGTVICGNDATTAVLPAIYAPHNLTLQLRYSSKCETVWARLYGGISGGEYYIGIADVGQAFRFVTYSSLQNGSRNWSNMQNDHRVTRRACVINARNGITLVCTDPY